MLVVLRVLVEISEFGTRKCRSSVEAKQLSLDTIHLSHDDILLDLPQITPSSGVAHAPMEEGDTSSGAASFVKRRKPKGLASRVSSAYDEPDDASQAAGPSIPTTASGTSASSTPRRMLSRGGSDEEQEPDAGGVVFRPRARGARSTRAVAP